MSKGGVKRGFFERLAIKYLEKYSNAGENNKEYKLTLYNNLKPSVFFKVEHSGELKIASTNIPSRLEKATKEEINKSLEEFKKRIKSSEDFESVRNGF
ncbi:hypothetical protein KAI04_02860 [Candidatus Pacearchaeota archaeon]|nr:hypothetical protein [Candidatus Pacearchaeota archaeon]